MFIYIFSTHVITLCTRFDICSSGKVNSGERYPNRVVSLGLNSAYMKIQTPTSCCTDNTWFFWIFLNIGTDKLGMDIFCPSWASRSQWGIKFLFTEICGKYQNNNFPNFFLISSSLIKICRKTRGVYLWVFKIRPLTRPKTHGFWKPTGEFNLYVVMLDFFTRTCIDEFKKPVLVSTGF